MSVDLYLNGLLNLLLENPDRTPAATRVAESLVAERRYRWVGLYEVTAADIGLIACTGTTPPAFPRFPISKGLCGSAVALSSIVNAGNVQADPRWLATFGSTRSEIIVPVLTIDGKVVGLIDVESDLLNAFSADDEQFLSRCAPLLLPLFESSPTLRVPNSANSVLEPFPSELFQSFALSLFHFRTPGPQPILYYKFLCTALQSQCAPVQETPRPLRLHRQRLPEPHGRSHRPSPRS